MRIHFFFCINYNTYNLIIFRNEVIPIADSKLECEKKELLLGINAFDRPTETSGAKAWGNLVANLAFMTRGTMPSDPEMGCDIPKYEFRFIDDVKEEIEELLRDQISTYLPDIPLETVSVDTYTTDTGRVILLIKIIFNMEDNEDNVAVIAAEKSNSIINFTVV